MPTCTAASRRCAPRPGGRRTRGRATGSRSRAWSRRDSSIRPSACCARPQATWAASAQSGSSSRAPSSSAGARSTRIEALLEGRARFRSRRDRPEAIRLLLRARQLAPGHFEANFDLAGLLGAPGRASRAARILVELAARARGSRAAPHAAPAAASLANSGRLLAFSALARRETLIAADCGRDLDPTPSGPSVAIRGGRVSNETGTTATKRTKPSRVGAARDPRRRTRGDRGPRPASAAPRPRRRALPRRHRAARDRPAALARRARRRRRDGFLIVATQRDAADRESRRSRSCTRSAASCAWCA